MLWGDKVLVDGDSKGDSFLIALDPATGETLWRRDRMDKGISYSAPFVRELAGSISRCRKGIGTSLVAVPLACLGLVVPVWGMVQTAMLLNVVVTALTGTLLFLYVRRLGYGECSGVVIALVFGLGTMAWPYSKYFFSEPLNGLCLLAAAYFLLPANAEEDARHTLARTLLSGVFVGLAVATRFANAVLVAIYLALLL